MFDSRWWFSGVISLKEDIFSENTCYIMKTDSPSLDYCMKLLRRGPNTFTQFIDILIETKQNDIIDLLLNTLP